MRPRFGLCLLIALAACESKAQETPDAGPRQTVSLRLLAPGMSGELEMLINLPEAADPKPVVEALSTALHGAIGACAGGSDPLRIDGDRVVALRLEGEAIRDADIEPGAGSDCLEDALLQQKLARNLTGQLDVQVLLRAAPKD